MLREYIRSQVELGSLRILAEATGVSRSTLHKFVNAGTMPHPRVRRLLALAYLNDVDVVEEMELVRPYVAALETLVADVPGPQRGRVAADLLERVARHMEAAGEAAPRWLRALRQRPQALALRLPLSPAV